MRIGKWNLQAGGGILAGFFWFIDTPNLTRMAKLIPDELVGKNTELSSSEKAADAEAAKALYQRAVDRLLHPQEWSSLAGALSAKFELFAETSQKKNEPATQGDRIRIDIPGPGRNKGEGHDWVMVKLIQSDHSADGNEEYTGMKVAPTDDPFSASDDAAHFFKPGSTSTFLIHRKGREVTAAYYGRNEKVNSQTESVADKVRNALVALGALAGFSELQWKSLVQGFLG